MLRNKSSYQYKHKVAAKHDLKERKATWEIPDDPLEEIFD